MPVTLAQVAVQLKKLAVELESDEKADVARDADLAKRVGDMEQFQIAAGEDIRRMFDTMLPVQKNDIPNLKSRLTILEAEFSIVRDAANNAKAVSAAVGANLMIARRQIDELVASVAAMRSEVDALKAAPVNPPTPPTPPVDPPTPPVSPTPPPNPTVTHDPPLRISDRTAIVNLGGRTVEGIELEPYAVQSLTINGPGTIIGRYGEDAVKLRKMADGGVATINGDVTIKATEAACVSAPQIALLRMLGGVAECEQTYTQNRQTRPAAIWCPQTAVDISDYVIIGGNSSIYAPNNASFVKRCFLSPEQLFVDGYAVTGGQCDQLLILPLLSGRGWLCENINGQPASIGSLTRSVVLGWDQGPLLDNDGSGTERWYGRSNLDGPAVRVRYGAQATVRGNHILSVGGGDWDHATGLMISGRGGVTSTYAANWVAALLTNFVGNFRARALSLESHGSLGNPANDIFDGNDFWSNHALLSTTGNDNRDGCYQGTALSASNRWGLLRSAPLYNQFVSAAQSLLTAIGLSGVRAATARYDQAIDALFVAVLHAEISPEAALWRNGDYCGEGQREECAVEAFTIHPNGVPMGTNLALWFSHSQRTGIRRLDLGGSWVYAPGSEVVA